MPRVTASDRERRELLTVPELERRTGIGAKRLRRAIRAGELPAYTAASTWPRIYWPEFLSWLRSTRVRPTDHARARVAEVLDREAAGSP